MSILIDEKTRVIVQAIAGGTILSASPCHTVTLWSAGRSATVKP